jgi:hypothetical protein
MNLSPHQLLITLAVLLAGRLVHAAPGDSNRPDLEPFVALLADPSQTVRDAAAAEIREALAADPAARTNDHGHEYWDDRLRQIKPGMKHAEVMPLLTAEDRPLTDEERLITHLASGGTNNLSMRLDDYWTVNVYYYNPDVVHEMPPQLTRRARNVWIAPPDDFTGRWTTYFVNGQQSHDIDYRGGKYHGTFTAFHDNGARSYEQHYDDGVTSGADTGWYADGVMAYAGEYVDGRQDGVWTHWYSNGRLRSRSHYQRGKQHGLDEAWYPDGQPNREVSYRDGKHHGGDRYWDADGKLAWDRSYINGERQE